MVLLKVNQIFMKKVLGESHTPVVYIQPSVLHLFHDTFLSLVVLRWLSTFMLFSQWLECGVSGCTYPPYHKLWTQLCFLQYHKPLLSPKTSKQYSTPHWGLACSINPLFSKMN